MNQPTGVDWHFTLDEITDPAILVLNLAAIARKLGRPVDWGTFDRDEADRFAAGLLTALGLVDTSPAAAAAEVPADLAPIETPGLHYAEQRADLAPGEYTAYPATLDPDTPLDDLPASYGDGHDPAGCGCEDCAAETTPAGAR